MYIYIITRENDYSQYPKEARYALVHSPGLTTISKSTANVFARI